LYSLFRSIKEKFLRPLAEIIPGKKFRLWLVVLILSIVLAVILGYRDYQRYRNNIVAAEGRNNRMLAEMISHEMDERIIRLSKLTKKILGEWINNPEDFKISSYLCRTIEGSAATDLWLTDQSGALLFSCTGRLPDGENLSDHPAFLKARELPPNRISGGGIDIEQGKMTYFLVLPSRSGVALMEIPLTTLVEDTLNKLEWVGLARLWIMDGEGTLLYHNRRPEMVGRNIFSWKTKCRQCHESFIAQQSMNKQKSGVMRYRVGGEIGIAGFSSTLMFGERWTIVASEHMEEILSSRKVEAWWLISIMLLCFALIGTVVVSVLRRQQEKRFYERMVQTEKLAALGRLSAGVVHQIRNPLNNVILNAGLLKRDKKTGENVLNRLDIILSEGNRVSAIIDNMRKFSRDAEINIFHPIDARGLVEEALSLVMAGNSKKDIEVIKNLSDNLPLVEGDRVSLREAMINIIINAYDAIEEKGRLEIAAYSDGDKVAVSFTDNGAGISKEIQSRMFEPFFTTKDVEEGTGLGLSVALGIVEKHGGDITIESEENKGTTVTMWLPVNR